MIIKGNKGAILLFKLLELLFGEEIEVGKILDFIDKIKIMEDDKSKQEYEPKLKNLIKIIASYPEPKPLSDLHSLIMEQPFILRAYLYCWLRQWSEDLMELKDLDIPSPELSELTPRQLLGYLFQSSSPFWR